MMEQIEALPEGEITGLTPYLEIKVLNDGPDPTRKNRINEALSKKAVRLTAIHAVNVNEAGKRIENKPNESLDSITPEELALRIYRNKYDSEMPTELQSLLREAIREAEHANTNRK